MVGSCDETVVQSDIVVAGNVVRGAEDSDGILKTKMSGSLHI